MRTDDPRRLPPGVRNQPPEHVFDGLPHNDPEPAPRDAAFYHVDGDPPEPSAADLALGPVVDEEPTWEPIDTAPRDGTDVLIRFGEEDVEGRMAKWRGGRHFLHRKWQVGGLWVSTDGVTPLPQAILPTHWLRMPGVELPEAAPDEDAA